MMLDLNEEQVAELAELVTGAISDLAVEIRHTDSPSYRQGLRDRRTVLREIAAMLTPVPVQGG